MDIAEMLPFTLLVSSSVLDRFSGGSIIIDRIALSDISGGPFSLSLFSLSLFSLSLFSSSGPSSPILKEAREVKGVE